MLDDKPFERLKPEEAQSISDKYGAPSEKNSQYFAACFAKMFNIVYSDEQKRFYVYEEKRGAWIAIAIGRLLHVLGCFLHWYATVFERPELDDKRTPSFLNGIIRFLEGVVDNAEKVFAKRGERYAIHCANTMLVFDKKMGHWTPEAFSPKFYSRTPIPLRYKPDAQCPRFLNELLAPAVKPDDIGLLQLYFGQCLLGVNISQTFLLITGDAASGKSTLVNILEGLIGRQVCAEFRSKYATDKFETSRFCGKTLLFAKDVGNDYLTMSGARVIKSLTGNDTISVELKWNNEVIDLPGCLNIVITANDLLRIRVEGDFDAWKRRILWVPFKRMPPKERIANFDQLLLKEEGSGILNWALEGAAKLLMAGGVITLTDDQLDRLEELMALSRSFDCFAERHIHQTLGASITTEEAVRCFSMFCEKKGWPLLTERKVQHLFHNWMCRQGARLRTDIKRDGHSRRGYSGFQIRGKSI